MQTSGTPIKYFELGQIRFPPASVYWVLHSQYILVAVQQSLPKHVHSEVRLALLLPGKSIYRIGLIPQVMMGTDHAQNVWSNVEAQTVWLAHCVK